MIRFPFSSRPWEEGGKVILKKYLWKYLWKIGNCIFDSGYLKGNAILKFLIRLEFFFFFRILILSRIRQCVRIKTMENIKF